VQPTDPSTGFDQRNGAGQSGPTEAGRNGDVPFRAGTPPGAPANIPEPKDVDGGTLEHWIAEVQHIIDTTAQNPRQRADAIAELKVQYQQKVLGLKPPSQDD
jgi:hypothetical protein